MIVMIRAGLSLTCLLMLSGLGAAAAFAAQPSATSAGGDGAAGVTAATADPSGGAGPRPAVRGPRPVRKEAPSALEVVPWFSLAPQDSSLIRKPVPQGGIDMAAREDEPYITVYGRKKVEDLHADREHDFSAPSWSDLVVPRQIPIGPASSCSSGAYRTIGGQPATGMDLVGGLGGGRC